MNKIEGKVADFCPKCKNCKGTTNEYDGNDFVVITGVKCEDPYDGMTKTLNADSYIRCSMFEPKPDHGRYPWGKDKNENESMYSELIKASKRKDELIQDYREKLKKANELADSWKRDYEFVRDQLIHPIYDILYPDNPNRDINVTDFINNVKDLKVYADENGGMYKEIQEWREKCIARGIDVDRLLKESENKDKKISELESSRDAWSNTATARAEQVIEVTKDRDKWKKLYNSLSNICSDYDKRSKEKCEKKYRDEISKLQNTVTEKHVEIKGLKKDIIDLSYDRRTVESMSKKIAKLKQTISDQEITIKALLITIKEMCKEENENA